MFQNVCQRANRSKKITFLPTEFFFVKKPSKNRAYDKLLCLNEITKTRSNCWCPLGAFKRCISSNGFQGTRKSNRVDFLEVNNRLISECDKVKVWWYNKLVRQEQLLSVTMGELQRCSMRIDGSKAPQYRKVIRRAFTTVATPPVT